LIDGVVVINKSAGTTSHQEVQHLRRLLPGVKAGHTGTLDPMATGVLPVCLGKATRLAEYIIEQPKCYRAAVTFGVTTDTGDADGRVIATSQIPTLDRNIIQIAVDSFSGVQEQLPPLYSAVKYKGKPLYRWTREGSTVPRKSRQVSIYQIEILSFSAETEPQLVLDITCSKGTYIRTLAVDLGQKIGCGAHLAALQRLSVGPYVLQNSLTTADFARLVENNTFRQQVLPLDSAVAHLPKLELDDRQTEDLRQGREVLLSEADCHEGMILAPAIRIYDQHQQFRALTTITIVDGGCRLKTLKFLLY
jgi:tRNA pseudouridine55 synthase